MPRPGLPKLIATDLDGTIVRTDDTVSGYTHEVFDQVRAAGMWVVGATGRGPRLLGLCRRDLPMAGHLVLAGGGRVVDLSGDEPVVLRDDRMDGPVVAALIGDLEAVAGPLMVMVEALDGPDEPLLGDVDPGWPWPDRVEPMSRADALVGPVIKAFVRADGDADALLATARTVIPPAKAAVTQAGLGYVEICPPGVDKAAGLAVVAAVLGVDRAEVLVFGDMPNDTPMFRWAGWGRVAVGNAHPEVRALADEVTLTNDEDGVAVWLERLLSSVTGDFPQRG
jgi:hydroxymethylpyrimidine pyrophosphatase-like HAD family hydrolase